MEKRKTVEDALNEASSRLSSQGIFGRDALEITSRALGVSPRTVDQRRNDSWPKTADAVFEKLLHDRQQGIPLAYLLGEWDFCEFTLVVTPDALIPRPETEEFFDFIQKSLHVGSKTDRCVVDVGTGTGCLALSLARRFPWDHVIAVDVSPRALAVARGNARRHGLESRVAFVESDLLSWAMPLGLDVVVANLPYVTTGDCDTLAPEVRNEPRLALDGGPDGLHLIRRLILQASKTLSETGSLFLEVGQGQAGTVRSLLESVGFMDVETRPDFNGVERFVRGSRS